MLAQCRKRQAPEGDCRLPQDRWAHGAEEAVVPDAEALSILRQYATPDAECHLSPQQASTELQVIQDGEPSSLRWQAKELARGYLPRLPDTKASPRRKPTCLHRCE